MLTVRTAQVEDLGVQTARRARTELEATLRRAGLTVQPNEAKDQLDLWDASGRSSSLVFGRDRIDVVSAEGRNFQFHYNDDRTLRSVVDPAGNAMAFRYDELQRLTTVQRGSHPPFVLRYDSEGRAQSLVYPDRSASHFEYDASGRTATVTDRNDNSRRFEYGSNGLPSVLVDPRGAATFYGFGEDGALDVVELPGGSRQTYQRGVDGTIAIALDDNPVACIDSDPATGETHVRYPDGTELRLKFDGPNLVSATDASTSTKLHYDASGCLIAEETDGRFVRYERDAVGLVMAIEGPEGRRTVFRRDREGRLAGLEDAETRFTISYELSGTVGRIAYPNGTAGERQTDDLGRPTAMRLASGGAGPLLDTKWAYDSCDRVTAEEAAGAAAQRFLYDLEGRLISVESSDPWLNRIWALDANGNRVSENGTPCEVNSADQLVGCDGQRFAYDTRGNLTTCRTQAGPVVCKYNYRGQLVESETTGTGGVRRTRYAYDALGRRVLKTCGDKTTRYTWAGQWLWSEESESNGVSTRIEYVVAPDLGIPLAQRTSDGTFCIHHGRRFEPLAMTDYRGRVVWSARYQAFGVAEVARNSIVPLNFRLAGQYFDEETGLHYNLARYYDPQLGRYLQRDPLGYASGSWNDYIYCGGDPLNRYDPTGEFLQILAAVGIGAAIGAVGGAGLEMWKQHKANPNAPFNWSKIGKEALIGGAVGAVGGLVLSTAPMLAGALGGGLAAATAATGVVGGAAAAIQTCMNAALHHETVTPGDLLKSFVGGGIISAVTAGVGGLVVNKLGQAATEATASAESAATTAAKDAAQLGEAPAVGAVGDVAASKPTVGPAVEEASQPSCGDPVNSITGAVITSKTDFTLPGALELELSRSYSSQSAASQPSLGCFGPGWASTWGQFVRIEGDQAVYHGSDGRWIQFDLGGAADRDWHRNKDSGKYRLRRAEQGFEVRDPQRRVLRFQWSIGARWLLTGIADPNGYSIRFSHDDSGTLNQVVHTGGYRLAVESSPTRIHRVTLVARDTGPVELVRYEYDEAGRLSRVIDRTGQPFSYAYDASNRLVKWTDRRGSSIEYAYDAQGRCVRSSGPDGLFRYTFEFDDQLRTNSVTDSMGHTSAMAYNQRQQIVARTDPRGNTTRFAWDAQSNKVEERDAAGRGIHQEFDPDGNPLLVRDFLDRTTQIRYNDLGLAEVLVDAAGKEWAREYDQQGNLVAARGPDGAVWKYERDSLGNVSRVVDPLNNPREFGYDTRGLVIWASDAKGKKQTLVRDSFGRVIERKDPLGHTTTFTYNAQGKLAKVVQPDNSTLRWEYDVEGNMVRRTDAQGGEYQYRYGTFDLLREIQKPSGGKILLDYDTEARLTRVTNEVGAVWTYEYNETGQVVRECDFHGRVQRYEYDASGLCVRRVNGAGEELRLERDLAGQLIGQSGMAEDEALSYCYDPLGQVKTALRGGVQVGIERDAYGRVVRESQNGRAVESVFDKRGLRVKRTSSGEATEWAWDANGLPKSLKLGGQEFLEFVHDDAGRQVERRAADGLVLRNGYDAMDRLESQWLGVEAGAKSKTAVERKFRYNENGDPVETADSKWGSTKFGYDVDGRIEKAEGQRGPTETFRYDLTGNIEGAARPALTSATRFYGKDGRLWKIGRTEYVWDADGRLSEKREDGKGRWKYAWSADGRLKSVAGPGGRWTYQYDAFGRRMAKSGPKGSSRFVWDGAVVAEELRSSGESVEWVHEPGTFRPLAKRVGSEVLQCVTDQIGTPRELVGAGGVVKWCALLGVWGDGAEVNNGRECPIRFQGQWWDEESGLSYNWNRYYDPGVGQYLSPDPIGLDGGTRGYGYVHNPMAWVDPLGLVCQQAASGADSNQYAKLKEFYRQSEKYGAGGTRELESGRVRFYGKITPARTQGEMAGAQLVREWDPESGLARHWYETVDQSGRVRSVAPKPALHTKNHFVFDEDGNYMGTR